MIITPTHITNLKSKEIFVFGSNKLGHHIGGAARQAFQDFGAIWGKGFGFQGNSFAIPTLNENMKRLDLGELSMHVNMFISLAIQNINLKFLVTEIGCGIAGFKHSEIAPLFQSAKYIENIYLPEKFLI